MRCCVLKDYSTGIEPRLTDEELISEFRSGSDEAFEIIASRYIGLISSAAKRYRLSFADADDSDMLQEGMVAERSSCPYSAWSPLSTWAHRSAPKSRRWWGLLYSIASRYPRASPTAPPSLCSCPLRTWRCSSRLLHSPKAPQSILLRFFEKVTLFRFSKQ